MKKQVHHQLPSRTIDSSGFHHLFAGLPPLSARLTSVRMMFAFAISERVFHGNVADTLRKHLLELCDFEYDREDVQSYSSLASPRVNWGNLKYVLNEVYRKPYVVGGVMSNKINAHHIISSQGFAINNLTKQLILNYNTKQYFADMYPIYIANTDGFSKVCGLDGEGNQILLTGDRHNRGLNAWFVGNMLPHHQLLAELCYVEGDLLQQYERQVPAIVQLRDLLCDSYFEQLYRQESYAGVL